MKSPSTPADEDRRLAALAEFDVLDTEPEATFDELVAAAVAATDAPMSMITLVDRSRQWFKARIGLEATETSREVSFCGHVVADGSPLIVEDTLADERFIDNPLVTAGPRLRAYAGVPLRTEAGHVIGTLCVADRYPRRFEVRELHILEVLARQAMEALVLRQRMRALDRDRRAAHDDALASSRVNALLEAIAEVQNSFLVGRPNNEVFGAVLDHFLELTDSAFGFIGEVYYDEPGVPHLVTHAITDLAWNEETRRIYEDMTARGGMVFRNLGTLFGTVMVTSEVVVANEPRTDPRRGGLPHGHPPLNAFLGLPVLKGGTLLGMVGVANRPGGYDNALVEFLEPFVSTCAGLFEARRAQQQRREVQVELERTLDELRRRRDELARFLDMLSVGTAVVDSSGMLIYVSETGRALAGLEQVGLGQAWSETLIVDERARSAIDTCRGLPEVERSRIGARLGGADGLVRPVEIDVRDDPRDPSHRILFIYDVSERLALRSDNPARHAGMVGDSAAMRECFDAIDQVAAGVWTVLIEGETGSGKELVARAIHRASSRRDGPFVAVNCAGLTDTLLSAELFGHTRGAFTGASSERPGLFEAASGGTIFLDEIGDVSLAMQRVLLRVLQEREVTRVGENRPRKIDVRVLAATHRDIQAMAERGEFRQDLLYRIRIVRLSVPPLRERVEDIPSLVAFFLADDKVTGAKKVRDIELATLRCLMAHDWPGNVRELRGVIEHAVVHSRSPVLGIADLPEELREGVEPAPVALPGPSGERERILEALRATGGNRSKAAKQLGIGRATLYRRLDALGIDPKQLK